MLPARLRRSCPEDLGAIVTSGTGDPFCRPLEGTPSDVFGRVQGSHSITASNIAKYDALHSVIVFDEHNPLALSRELIIDTFDVGFRWAEKAVEFDPMACYFLPDVELHVEERRLDPPRTRAGDLHA